MDRKLVALILCFALLLCGCQAAGNKAGTEPTVAPTAAPTVAPTQEPNQEPTQEPTEPPLPAGPIDVDLTHFALSTTYNSEKIDESGHLLITSELMHSREQIEQYLIEKVGNALQYEVGDEPDWTPYTDAFFEENSVVVILRYNPTSRTCYDLVTEGIYRAEDGAYRGVIFLWPQVYSQWWVPSISIGFVVMKGVTDDAPVEFDVHLWNWQETNNYD